MSRKATKSRAAGSAWWHCLVCAVVACMLFVACKPQVPSDYLSPGEMEDILYDYHIAMNLSNFNAEDVSDKDVNMAAYKRAVLKKHDVSEQEFEASLEYYMRHTERMHDIYEHLVQRLSDEALAQGASASEINQFGAVTSSGDTANVWSGAKAIVLSSRAPYNSYSFAFKADTAYHKGDRFMLSFESQYIIQEGSREGEAVLAIRYTNDSVAFQAQRISSNTHYNVNIYDHSRLGIKEIRGYFMLSAPSYSNTSTLSLVCISNLQLFRMHTSEPKPQPVDNQTVVPGETRVPPEVKDSTPIPVPVPGRRPTRDNPQPQIVLPGKK